MKKITFISDTHNYHKLLTNDLPGGDILIHTGDISSMGYLHEVNSFCKWFNELDNYKYKIFIAGNHDWFFHDNWKAFTEFGANRHKSAPRQTADKINELLDSYKNIIYLQDSSVIIDGLKIWGSPWQPWFHDWAFNLPRNGEELKAKCDAIPSDTDILLTHGPAFGILDDVEYNRGVHLGCEILIEKIKQIKPKIHCCGHIHSGNGYQFDGDTHFINASSLNEDYDYFYKPFSIEI